MATVVETDYGPVDIETGESHPVSAVDIFNPAIRGTVKDSGDPCIVLAVDDQGREMIVDQNGEQHWVSIHTVVLDWRYDVAKEEWVDASGEPIEDKEGG